MRILLECLLLGMVLMSVPAFGMTLVKDRKTSYVIVVDKDAIEPEKTAAKELQVHLKLITGADFPILESKSPDKSVGPTGKGLGPTIWVGASKKAKELAPDVDWDSLGTEGIVIKTVGNDLLFAGGRPRGTLYAVYSFLEDVLGVRWWTATESFIPKKPTLNIASLDMTYIPQFQYREVLNRAVSDDTAFITRMKVNGHWQNIPENYGGHFQVLGFCHTFHQLLPADRYFDKHPEWYSLVNGKRTYNGAQLCLTNLDMRKELTLNALEWIRQNPNAGIISISQNDCDGACECEKCKAIDKYEGSKAGTLIHFVNAVAADIAKEYPNFKVDTLAYTYTQEPPLHARPAKNVSIRLCSTGTFQDRPLSDPINSTFRNEIKKWSSVSHNLSIWYYATNFLNYLVPQPNFYNWGSDIQFFTRNNVTGVLTHDNPDTGCMAGDFVRLRGWVMSHMLWNPSLNEKKLTKEFLEGYYGPAAPCITKYLDIIHKPSKTRPHMSMSHKIWGYLTIDEMNKATRLFDSAEKAVTELPEYRDRVHRDRLPLDHMWLLNYNRYKHDAQAAHTDFMAPEPVASCNDQIQILNQAGAGQYFENAGNRAYQIWMQNLAQIAAETKNPTAAVPEECAELPSTDWVDFQENSFWTHYFDDNLALVDDPLASNGKAIRMPGDIIYKIVNLPFFNITYLFPKPVHCYIRIRCEGEAKTGPAYTAGISDKNGTDTVRKEISLDEAGDNVYHTIDLGQVDVTQDKYVWMLPCGDLSKVKAIYIDRVFFVREKK